MSSEIKSSARPTPKETEMSTKPKQTVEITYETTDIQEKTDEIVDKLRKLNEKIEKLTHLDAWDQKIRNFKRKIYETKLNLSIRSNRCRCKFKHTPVKVCNHNPSKGQSNMIIGDGGIKWPEANHNNPQLNQILTNIST